MASQNHVQSTHVEKEAKEMAGTHVCISFASKNSAPADIPIDR